jgi:hypothetical protein
MMRQPQMSRQTRKNDQILTSALRCRILSSASDSQALNADAAQRELPQRG